jgi:hypothetical protein
MFEVDDYVGSPNSNLKFFSGDNLPRVLKQYCEDFEGQALQLNAVASPPELAGLEVSFKKPKGHAVRRLGVLEHSDGISPRTCGSSSFSKLNRLN